MHGRATLTAATDTVALSPGQEVVTRRMPYVTALLVAGLVGWTGLWGGRPTPAAEDPVAEACPHYHNPADSAPRPLGPPLSAAVRAQLTAERSQLRSARAESEQLGQVVVSPAIDKLRYRIAVTELDEKLTTCQIGRSLLTQKLLLLRGKLDEELRLHGQAPPRIR